MGPRGAFQKCASFEWKPISLKTSCKRTLWIVEGSSVRGQSRRERREIMVARVGAVQRAQYVLMPSSYRFPGVGRAPHTKSD